MTHTTENDDDKCIICNLISPPEYDKKVRQARTVAFLKWESVMIAWVGFTLGTVHRILLLKLKLGFSLNVRIVT